MELIEFITVIGQWLSSLSLTDFRLVSVLVVVFMQAIGKGVVDRVHIAAVVLWQVFLARFWPARAVEIDEAIAADWTAQGTWYNIVTFALAYGLASIESVPKDALVLAIASLLVSIGGYEIVKNMINLRNTPTIAGLLNVKKKK